MRRWLWPYAILVVALLLAGVAAAGFALFGLGPERAGARLDIADAVLIEPATRSLISMLDMVSPFDLPAWFKQAYAVLVLVALAGLALSLVVGLILLPVFYALYRGAQRD